MKKNIKIFTIYDEEFFIIRQFDNYKDLSKYTGISIPDLRSYLARLRKYPDRKIKNKITNELCYIRKDEIEEEK